MIMLFETNRGYVYEAECEMVSICDSSECCSLIKFPNGHMERIEDNTKGRESLFAYIKKNYKPKGMKEK